MTKRWLLLLFLLGMPCVLPAQDAGSAHAWPLTAAHVAGSRRFTEADIVAAAGLKAGAKVTVEDLQQAANQLLATGAFAEVGYEYVPAAAGLSVKFKVADAPRFLPVSFDNFVWFTEPQLKEAIHARVPLFHGEVPPDGALNTQVSDALQALLATRGIAGQVQYRLLQEGIGGPIKGQAYYVSGVDIAIRTVTFPGAAEGELAELQNAAQVLLKQTYVGSVVRAFAENNLSPIYWRHGFLKVGYGLPVTSVVSEDIHAPQVAITIPVMPGPQYHLAALHWSGNNVLPATELENLISLRPGQIANLVALRNDFEQVHKAYGSRGYLRQRTHEVPTFDEAGHAVSYDLQVEEGDQFKFADVELLGLSPQVHDRVRGLWSMRPGDPFDTGYSQRFLNAAMPLLGQTASMKQEIMEDDKTKTVRVTIRFVRKGT